MALHLQEHWLSMTVLHLLVEISIYSPAFTNLDTFYVAKNTTDVGTITAKDPEGFPITYSLNTSTDMGLFQIDSKSGKLSFLAVPDFTMVPIIFTIS